MTAWAVPQMWVGQTAAVLASGPGMSAAVADQVRAARIAAIVVNTTFRLAPWADMLYASDAAWWEHNPDALRFSGLRVSCSEVAGVLRIKNGGMRGFDPDPLQVRTGGNSGYAAVHLAAQAGAARILLCGFDMAGGHWHADHPEPLRTPRPRTFERWIARFDALAAALRDRRVEVLNCTPGSALRAFPMCSLDDALALCRQEG